jgi:hypothetical protein
VLKNKKEDFSKGGSKIHRHEEQENQGFRPPADGGVFAEEIISHFEELFPNRESFVFHEIISDLVHIDVNIMKPTTKDNFYVMYTTGMSDLPMNLPEEIDNPDDFKYAELFMFMPDSWNPGRELAISSDIPYEDYWAIQMIKFLARFPHEYKTWLGHGHTIPNGPDYEPVLNNSEMSGIVLSELDENFSPLTVKNDAKVRFYMVVPVTRAETEYKLEHGMQALEKKFIENNLQLVIDMYRKSVI